MADIDPSTAAYVSATAVLVAAELLAVTNRTRGDTITENVKARRPLHMAMTSLLTWGLVHFTVDPEGWGPNVTVAVVGGLVALPFFRRR